ncbi:type II toxin-antitoxin system RelE/ParE family toxin [Microbacterium tumbae]
MTYQLDLGEDAEADIDDVLEWSVFRFGESVRDGYQALIGATLASIARDPELAGSHDRHDLGRGIRTVHLRTCRNEVSPAVRRIASPRHFVVYRHVGEVVQVVRLLHEAMDLPAQRIPE